MLSVFVALLVQGLALTTANQTLPSADEGRPNLKITAISASNNVSTLQCWEIQTPFKTSDTPGTDGVAALALGEIGKAQYIVLPAGFDGGLHVAPANQWVYFTAGLAHVTLYAGDDEAWFTGGRNGLLFAADTADVSELGHYTNYPSKEETIAITIPTEDGLPPPYEVVNEGPCVGQDEPPRGYQSGRGRGRGRDRAGHPGRPRKGNGYYKD
ncbi:MAG: hypothetical protein M1815_003737 [Lichina confinis]|nr:MAG: hypothetical protein M1815_003737 [Lichina confinis]